MNLPLTVCIATAGQVGLLRRTLGSLAACEKPPAYAGALIVENGPRCGVEAEVARRPKPEGVRYLHVCQGNKSHALNVALQQLPEGLIVFLDDDVRVAPSLLTAYADGAAGLSAGEYYGGPLGVDLQGELPQAWMQPYLPKSARGWRLPHKAKTLLKKEKFLGPNWAAFTADLKRIGGFETRLGPGARTGATGQETDAQNRLKAAGAKPFYLPQAEAWHFIRSQCLTPEWIVARARRHGLEWGINRARRQRNVRANLLLYALRHACDCARGAWLRQFGDEHARFRADFLAATWQGRWQGLRIGMKWDAVPRIMHSEMLEPLSIPA